jgi:hypothetical protein
MKLEKDMLLKQLVNMKLLLKCILTMNLIINYRTLFIYCVIAHFLAYLDGYRIINDELE